MLTGSESYVALQRAKGSSRRRALLQEGGTMLTIQQLQLASSGIRCGNERVHDVPCQLAHAQELRAIPQLEHADNVGRRVGHHPGQTTTGVATKTMKTNLRAHEAHEQSSLKAGQNTRWFDRHESSTQRNRSQQGPHSHCNKQMVRNK